MKLSFCIHQFFNLYLPHIKGVSHHTIKSYRDTFKLFLPFAASHYGIKIRSLRLKQISSDLIMAFLDELQHERKNLPKTRNQRLAAFKSFAKMLSFMIPEERELADRILNIPQKRAQKPLIGFLYQEEVLEVFESVDLKRNEGFRDYVLLHLLYDSGARASEISTLNMDYFNPQQKTLAILGKGDRPRLIELEPRTVKLLQIYRNIGPECLSLVEIPFLPAGNDHPGRDIMSYAVATLTIRIDLLSRIHGFRRGGVVLVVSMRKRVAVTLDATDIGLRVALGERYAEGDRSAVAPLLSNNAAPVGSCGQRARQGGAVGDDARPQTGAGHGAARRDAATASRNARSAVEGRHTDGGDDRADHSGT